jgi:hypothetical protein
VGWEAASDRADLVALVGLYVAVVSGLWLAFVVFTTDNVLGLFLSYGWALLVGVGGPVFYTCGFGASRWRASA